MKVKLILPALTEATSPFFRPIKYSLFPPLGLATLAAYLDPDDDVCLVDEHVERLTLDDDPDLVIVQVYITNARRAYEIADHYRSRGVRVCLGGLHVTSLPHEAAQHADHIFLGPGEESFPRFLADLRTGSAAPCYSSRVRTLVGLPPVRRDLIRRHLYLVPNSLVVTRGCPHHCDFCYKDAFFEGGRGFYVQAVDDALAEIERLPGRHLYFLDDHLLGNSRFASALFDGMRGMGRLWQAAATVDSVLRGDLIEQAAAAGLRSLFVGFETLDHETLRLANKRQNFASREARAGASAKPRPGDPTRDYARAIRRLDDLGIMVNGSFVFGLDGQGPDVFDRTVDWAVGQGITTATFHIATPYPGTAFFRTIDGQGRLLHRDWDRYDTRHVVFEPRGMTRDTLEAGYWRAYRSFYSWPNLFRGARHHQTWQRSAHHLAYAAGWKRLEPLWDLVIRARRLTHLRPVLETVLSTRRRDPARSAARTEVTGSPGMSGSL